MKQFTQIIFLLCMAVCLHLSAFAQRQMQFSGKTPAGKEKTLSISEGAKVYVILQNDSVLHKGRFWIVDSLHFLLGDAQKNLTMSAANINTLSILNTVSVRGRKNLIPLLGAAGAIGFLAVNRNNVASDGNRWLKTFASSLLGAGAGYGLGLCIDITVTRKNMIHINTIKTKNYK